MKRLLLFLIGIGIQLASFSQAEVKQQGDTVKIVKRGGGNAYLDVIGILKTPMPPAGSSTDSIVTWDPVSKQFKRISRTSLLTHTHPQFQVLNLNDSLNAIQNRIQTKLNITDAVSTYITISRTLDSLSALRSAIAAKLNITDAASTYITIARILDSLAAVQARIQSKEPLLGFTPVPNTRTINGYPLTSNITLNKSDVGLGNVDNTSDANKPISTATQTALDGKVPNTRTVNGYALSSNVTLTKSDVGLSNVPNTDATNASNISSGTLPDARLSSNVTVQGNTFNGNNQLVKLDGSGKLPTSTIPSLALVETFVVGSQAAMLALSAQMGDVAVRTDNNRSYILQSEPASTLSNWVQLLNPDSETDPVYTASSWFSTTNNASNWNTAYSWGNHASAGYVPSSRTITINGTTYDLSVSRSWSVGDVVTSGSYSNPSWITSLAWSKLTSVPSTFTPSAHTHPYSDLTGTVPTWNQNTTGNAATATNATQWSGNNYGGSYSTGGIFGFMINNNTTAAWERATVSQVQTALGLGSNAYSSTAFLPLTGGTLSGTINGTIGSFGSSLSAPDLVASAAIYLRYNGSYLYGRNGADNAYIPLIRINGSDQVSIDNNGVGTVFGGAITAISYSGSGTGLTGLASNLTAGYIHNRYWSTDANNIWQSGVYTFYNGTNVPSGDFGMISIPVFSGVDGSNRYNLQIGAGLSGDPKYRITNIYGDGTWYNFLTAYNYNSYSPTLTGTGASGTWGISVTGNAATVTNGVYTNTTQTISGEKSFSSTYTYVNTLRASGDVIAYYTSDRRLKKNIRPIANALDKISLLSGNEYDWDETLQSTYKGHDYGVIAQEVESVLPGVTHKKADGFFGIKNQNQIIALLVQALKELKNEVELLKK